MRVLAVDLGHTIGYAVVDDSPRWTVGVIELGAFELLKIPTPVDLVIIERPTFREPPDIQDRYEAEIHTIRMMFRGAKISICRPADWMQRFNHYPLPGRGKLLTQHEKDAWRIAHWAREKFVEDKRE